MMERKGLKDFHQVVLSVFLDHIDGEVGGGEDVPVVGVVAVVVEQRVEALLLQIMKQ